MKRKVSQDSVDPGPLPQSSFADLRGRQSVRATFRLSEKAIDTISVLSVHLGIKQKSLFDHLLEDLDSLNRIARRSASRERAKGTRIQKTFVISRKTLSVLEKTSRENETPRDALVERSIQRLLPLIEKEKERHRKRKKILNLLDRHREEGERLLAQSRNVLGEEDPIHDELRTAQGVLNGAYGRVKAFVDRGEIIEDF